MCRFPSLAAQTILQPTGRWGRGSGALAEQYLFPPTEKRRDNQIPSHQYDAHISYDSYVVPDTPILKMASNYVACGKEAVLGC